MKRILSLIGIVIIAFACAVCLSACGTDRNEPSKLPVPKGLCVQGTKLYWEDNIEAVKYTVYVNGVERDVNYAECDAAEVKPNHEGEYEVKVKACGDGVVFNDSEWTDIMRFVPIKLSYNLVARRGGYYITCNNGNDEPLGNVLIPEYYDDLPIVGIDSGAFQMKQGLRGVIIPKYVSTIGQNTFAYCDNLKSIKFMTENIEDVGYYNSYGGCTSLTELEITEKNETLKSDGNCIIRRSDNAVVMGCGGSVIPDYAESIESHAFYGQLALTSINIPGSVKSIGFEAFVNCYNLKNVFFEDGIEEVDIGAFAACLTLERIELPSSMIVYGMTYPLTYRSGLGLVFQNCARLSEIIVDKDNPTYYSDGNCVMRKSDDVLVLGCKTSIIPDYVTTIGENAFRACANLTQVIIPKNITRIEGCAFAMCKNLEFVALHEDIEYIDRSAFWQPRGLGNSYNYKFSVTIPNGAEFFDANSFSVFSHKNGDEIVYDENGYAYVYSHYLKIQIPQGNAEYKKYEITFKAEYFDEKERPSRIGYIFIGYSLTPNGAVVIDAWNELELYNLDGNVFECTVYPVWVKTETNDI